MKFSYQRNELGFIKGYSKRVFKLVLIIFNAVFNNIRKFRILKIISMKNIKKNCN